MVAATAVLAGCGSQGQASPAETAPPPLPAAPVAVADGAVVHEDPSLVALRDELRSEKIEGARAKIAHYRPLCDKDGYPLVGNVVRKSPKPELQPSELCADVRARPRAR